jgi:hypothetical protein
MSAPATKARPAPVSTTPPTSSRARIVAMVSSSSWISARSSAFSRSGRFSVTVATRSSIASRRVSEGMRRDGAGREI